MDCAQYREVLSARLDGEETAAEREAIDAHLLLCARCRRFADDAARITMLARGTAAFWEPHITEPQITVEPVRTIHRQATVLQALTDLEGDSTVCATAMMAHSAADMLNATRAALDCADIAAAAQRVLSRPTATDAGVLRAILEAAAVAAERCALECGQHASHHGHCRVHSESAHRTAQLCRSELNSMPG
jgi:Putative zinc-finger